MFKNAGPGEAWWVHNQANGGVQPGKNPIIDNVKNRPLWARFLAILFGLFFTIAGFSLYAFIILNLFEEFDLLTFVAVLVLYCLTLVMIGAGLRIMIVNIRGRNK